MLNQIFKNELLPVEQYKSVDFPQDFWGFFVIYLAPNNTETQKIAKGISSIYIRKIIYANDIDDIREKYSIDFQNASIFDNAFGIDFSQSKNFPFDYTLLTKYDSKLFDNRKIKFFADTRSCRNTSGSFLSNAYKTCDANDLAYNGFAALQNSLNTYIRQVITSLVLILFKKKLI